MQLNLPGGLEAVEPIYGLRRLSHTRMKMQIRIMIPIAAPAAKPACTHIHSQCCTAYTRQQYVGILADLQETTEKGKIESVESSASLTNTGAIIEADASTPWVVVVMVLVLELLELGIWEQNTAVSADFANSETCCCSKAKPDSEIRACSSAADPKSNI